MKGLGLIIFLVVIVAIVAVGFFGWLTIKTLAARRNPTYLLTKQAAKVLEKADEASKNGRYAAAEGYMKMYESLQRQIDQR